jgi:integrase
MAKKPLPLGTWGQIWTKPVHRDAKGRPNVFQARANYRDFDGRTRDVTARGKTMTEASNNLRSILKARVNLKGSDVLKPGDRISSGAELFMTNLQALVDEGVRSPGTYDTYRYHLDKNILPRIGEVRFAEATTPLVNKAIVAIRDEVGAASARTCKSIISGTMAIAVRHGALTLNPVRDIEILGKSRRKPPRSLTEEEREGWFELVSQDERAIRADLIDICKFMLRRVSELVKRWPSSGRTSLSRPVRSTAATRSSGSRAKAWYVFASRRRPVTDFCSFRTGRWPCFGPGGSPERPLGSPVFPDSEGGYRDPHNVRKSLRDVRQPVGSERRRELGRVLRHHRRKAGFTQADVVTNLGWNKTRLSLIETGRVRLEPDQAATLAVTYGLPRADRASLLELTELAGIRSLADELAWVTSHKFRKTTATILDDAGHSPRQIADQLGHSRTTTTMDDYIGRKVSNPAAAKALDEALRSIHEQDRQAPDGPA